MREEVWSSESKLLTHCSRQSYHHINLFRIPSPTGKGIYFQLEETVARQRVWFFFVEAPSTNFRIRVQFRTACRYGVWF